MGPLIAVLLLALAAVGTARVVLAKEKFVQIMNEELDR